MSYGVIEHNFRVSTNAAAVPAQVSARSWAPGIRKVDSTRSAAKSWAITPSEANAHEAA